MADERNATYPSSPPLPMVPAGLARHQVGLSGLCILRHLQRPPARGSHPDGCQDTCRSRGFFRSTTASAARTCRRKYRALTLTNHIRHLQGFPSLDLVIARNSVLIVKTSEGPPHSTGTGPGLARPTGKPLKATFIQHHLMEPIGLGTSEVYSTVPPYAVPNPPVY